MRSRFFAFAHVLVGKPASTFPGHALTWLPAAHVPLGHEIATLEIFRTGAAQAYLSRQQSLQDIRNGSSAASPVDLVGSRIVLSAPQHS